MSRKERHDRLIKIIENFPESRLYWLESVIDILNCPHRFVLKDESSMLYEWSLSFGDALMIHHAFSKEPFTKDKFEHALVTTANLVGIEADFAPRGFRGHDIIVENTKISLKTQADKSIKIDSIWISKYMELGKGDWSDQPSQLFGLVEAFTNHLKDSEKIWILRCLTKFPNWKYELVEIPKDLLLRSRDGVLEMKLDSRQMPKPGYCSVYGGSGSLDFQLYFDGGGERKLQIKNLNKGLCKVIGEWSFEPSPYIVE
ncbi:hypothetical protein [Algoriphagus alkaliphilus]|nr:hypothetical protein [Algoriphagus alkaliphilus]MBA4302510.1 restriction endonuclease [Cyclobacterium sp.]